MCLQKQSRGQCIGGSGGAKCLHFHAVFAKNWHNSRLAPPPPGGWRLPPLGNPGSATAVRCVNKHLWAKCWICCLVKITPEDSLLVNIHSVANQQSTPKICCFITRKSRKRYLSNMLVIPHKIIVLAVYVKTTGGPNSLSLLVLIN